MNAPLSVAVAAWVMCRAKRAPAGLLASYRAHRIDSPPPRSATNVVAFARRLKRPVKSYQWFGIFVVMSALCIIGLSCIMNTDTVSILCLRYGCPFWATFREMLLRAVLAWSWRLSPFLSLHAVDASNIA